MAYKDKLIIVGVDRLDYTKGLLEKVEAFETFLKKHREFDGKVVYLQIAVPCRIQHETYQNVCYELKARVAKTNRELRESGFKSSIQMIFDKVTQKDLALLYRKSRVAMVTPLRDGLNLVAMESVACQSSESPGVLILSQFAGAAETMTHAIQV